MVISRYKFTIRHKFQVSFSCLLNEADEFKEIEDGGSKMADTKMAILSLI